MLEPILNNLNMLDIYTNPKTPSNFKFYFDKINAVKTSYHNKCTSTLSGVIKLFSGLYKNDYTQYKATKQKIYNEALTELSIKDIWEYSMRATPLQLTFIEHLIKYKKREMSSSTQFKSHVWKATKNDPNDPSKKITHYLIGTIHFGSKNMCESPEIKEALANTNAVISELGNSWLLRGGYYLKNWLSKDPLKYAMDLEITEQTLKDNKSIQAFETLSDQLKSLKSLDSNMKMKNSVPQVNKIDNTMTPASDSIQKTLGVMLAIEEYMKGENVLDLDPGLMDTLFIYPRNVKWIFETKLKDDNRNTYRDLIDYLDKSSIPTCFVVGDAHLECNVPLTKAFDGFNLQKL